jgi:pimeloyl-ACP methyl ester carboxylesterase
LCAEWLDPAIIDEHQPFERDPSLDIYSGEHVAPYGDEFVARYRSAQLARNRRISVWADGQLRQLTSARHQPDGLDDLAFVVQGTAADLRFFDGSIDPSDRQLGVTLWGPPAVANYLPAGIGRCTTLRSWLNQWSIDHSLGDSLRWLGQIEAPVLVVVGTADPTVLPQMGAQMHAAAVNAPAELVQVKGATHYFENQPDQLDEALDALADWVSRSVEGAA